jgi:hypothetical protein
LTLASGEDTGTDNVDWGDGDGDGDGDGAGDGDGDGDGGGDGDGDGDGGGDGDGDGDGGGDGDGDGDGGGDGDGDGDGGGDGDGDGDGDGVPECFTDQECATGDPCLMGVCIAGSCEIQLLDQDNDGFQPASCGGGDCNDLNPNTNPLASEDCFDGDDNDCNGVADCFDPACANEPNCGCIPDPGGEVCDDGQDNDCDTTVDCNDADCAATPECGCTPNETGLCVNGFDDDCDGDFDCDDAECSGTPECSCIVLPEDCSNDVDDDCDLLIDCADPNCDGVGACACQGPPTPEVCDDNQDNDCDGDVDCADPDCIVSPACAACEPEICDDGIDNDCDDVIDCADEACAFHPACAPTPEICNNSLDDDNDGLVDCEDPDCANVPICIDNPSNCETAQLITGSGTFFGDTTGFAGNHDGSCGGDAGEAVYYFVLTESSHVVVDSIGTTFDSVVYVRAGDCPDGTEIGCDDDSGGMWAGELDFTILYPGTYFIFVDGYTIDPDFGPNEGPYQLNVLIDPNPAEVCDDGLDNDGDIYVDCADSDCTDVGACFLCQNGNPPGPEFGVAACTDGIDNDCDGDLDCDDDDCSASDYYVTECCNGTDQNNNGIPDDFNCRCNNDSECDDGQICYTHSAYTCGYPCDLFFGDVCPFVAAGSYCNDVTGQCEF